MKIFISWSGNISRQVAKILQKWLPKVLQSTKPFISTEMEKGIAWAEKLAKELETTDFGIICITRDNLSAPWLNFEAGALSKTPESYVCTFAFGLSPSDIPAPLSQFNATRYTKDDIKQLIKTINNQTKEPLDLYRLDDAFEARWQELEEQLEPVYKLTKKKVMWAYEESSLSSEMEINQVNTEFSVTNTQWYLDQDQKPDKNDCDILVYVYGKFSESKLKLEKIIKFAKSLDKKIPLIIFTKYASGDNRLSDEDLAIVSQQYSSHKLSNLSDTLIARLKEVV